MTRLMQRRWVRLTLGAVVGVPFAGLAAGVVYVQYRVNTKPVDHTFRPLVDSDGSLLLQDTSIRSPTRFEIIRRVAFLLYLFLPMVALYWLMRWRESWYRKWIKMVVRRVERGGPAVVKAGQWACTRQDLFSQMVRDELKRLYSEVSVHPFSETIRTIEEDLKKPVGELFASLHEKVLGSGSIGQVHLAYLHTGEKVAVKVMHEGVVDTIAHDFFIINALARLAHKWVPSLEYWDFPVLALAWTNHLAAQLDFRIEAEHLNLFREHFKDVDYVTFPRPIMSAPRVLVEEFAPGQPATPAFLQAQEEHVRDILASKGLNTYCKMLLRDNFIHGDMHPGNILVDTTDRHHPHVTMIDVGLCQKFTPREGKITHDLMEAFVKWTAPLCGQTLFAMGTTQRFANLDDFTSDLSKLFERYRPVKDSDDAVVTNILQSIFDVIRDHKVSMDPSFVNLMWSLLVLEGFINSLNPDFNMVRHCAPWLVSEGHVSPGLVRNIVRANRDRARSFVLRVSARTRDLVFGVPVEASTPRAHAAAAAGAA